MTGVLLVMVFMPIGSNQFSANSRKGKFGVFLGALGNIDPRCPVWPGVFS